MTDQEQWPGVLNTLTAKLQKNNFPHQVTAQKTMEEKVAKVLENPTIRNKICSWISNCSETKYSKSGPMASKLRDQGNEKFGARDNTGALKLYTESVICAPEVGPELSLAFGNRSAALFHLGHYQAASDDIKLALMNKYPKNTEHKLYQRQAQCLIRLGQYSEALKHLQNCRNALSYSKLSPEKQEAAARDLTALTTEAANLEKEASSRKCSLSTESGLEQMNNESLPGASDKLCLETSTDKVRGRYVTTNSAISAGEVIIRETPYSWVLLPEHSTSRCNQCLCGPLVAPLSCRRCTQPRYCSAHCQTRAWEGHHIHECGHLDLLHSVGIGHLAVRTLLTAGLTELLALQRQVQAGTLPSFSEASSYGRVLVLQHHLDRLPAEDQFQYTVTAALLLSFLHRHTAFLCPDRAIPGLPGVLKPLAPGMDVDEKVVHYIGGLLLRHIAQLISNAHAVTELSEGEAGEVCQVRLATAIYPSTSMLNHSCIPAIINYFSGNVLEVRAVRDIKRGEEVTNCYGPHYRRHTHQERQEMLQSQYGFKCVCAACSSSKERQFFSQFTASRCTKNINGCEGHVEVNFSGPHSTGGVCDECGLAQDLDLSWMSLKDECMRRPNMEMLVRTEKVMAAKLHKHHQDLSQVRDLLARSMVEAGLYSGAEAVLRMTLETTRTRYGEDSIEYGNELLKYTDIQAAQLNNEEKVDSKQMLKYLETAKRIFMVQYGENSSQHREILDKLDFFERIGLTKQA